MLGCDADGFFVLLAVWGFECRIFSFFHFLALPFGQFSCGTWSLWSKFVFLPESLCLSIASLAGRGLFPGKFSGREVLPRSPLRASFALSTENFFFRCVPPSIHAKLRGELTPHI